MCMPPGAAGIDPKMLTGPLAEAARLGPIGMGFGSADQIKEKLAAAEHGPLADASRLGPVGMGFGGVDQIRQKLSAAEGGAGSIAANMYDAGAGALPLPRRSNARDSGFYAPTSGGGNGKVY